jgi:hypothetical protein
MMFQDGEETQKMDLRDTARLEMGREAKVVPFLPVSGGLNKASNKTSRTKVMFYDEQKLSSSGLSRDDGGHGVEDGYDMGVVDQQVVTAGVKEERYRGSEDEQ